MTHPSPDEVSDFVSAALAGKTSAVAAFLDKYPASISVKNERGRTALISAADFGRESTVKLLLERGAAVDLTDNSGRSALSHADTPPIAEMLIKKGADVNLKDRHGRPPLVHAETTAMIDVLLKHGAEIDGGDGGTALMWAAYDGLDEIVTHLLEKGANIRKRDEYGYDAAMLASNGGHDELVKFLQEWPKKQEQRLKAKKIREHKKWLADTDCSKGLKKAMRAPRPFNFKKAS